MMTITKRGWNAGSGLLAVLIGILAVGTYFAVVIVLAILFPDLFQES